jgi:RimJ/RimL family protein N-acetyltransferase
MTESKAESVPPILCTERLELRQVSVKDAPLVAKAIVAEAARFQASFAWTVKALQKDPVGYARGSVDEWLEGVRFGYGLWLDSEFVGLAGLRSLDWAGRKAEYFYGVLERFEGRGLALEAVAALHEMARHELGIKVHWLRVMVDNPRSSVLAERLGFQPAELLPNDYVGYDGHAHDVRVYRLTTRR